MSTRFNMILFPLIITMLTASTIHSIKDAYPIMPGMTCMHLFGYVQNDRRCRLHSDDDNDYARWGKRTIFSVTSKKAGSTDITRNCFFGHLFSVSVYQCSQPGGIILNSTSKFNYEGRDVNLILKLPIIKTDAQAYEWPDQTPLNLSIDEPSFFFRPDGMHGKFNLATEVSRDGKWFRLRNSTFSDIYATQGNTDAYNLQIGTINAKPLWKYIDRFLMQTSNRYSYMEIATYYRNRSKKRRRRSAGTDILTTSACRRMFFNIDSPSGAVKSCEAMKQDHGDSFARCVGEIDTSTCNMDVSGPWEDGGIHDKCSQIIMTYLRTMYQCNDLDVIKYVQERDSDLALLIERAGNMSINNRAGIDLNNQIANGNLKDILGLQANMITYGKDFVDLVQRIEKSFKDYDTVYKEIDSRVVALERQVAISRDDIKFIVGKLGITSTELNETRHYVHGNHTGSMNQVLAQIRETEQANFDHLIGRFQNTTSQIQGNYNSTMENFLWHKMLVDKNKEESQNLTMAFQKDMARWKKQAAKDREMLKNRTNAHGEILDENSSKHGQQGNVNLGLAVGLPITFALVIIALCCICCFIKNNRMI